MSERRSVWMVALVATSVVVIAGLGVAAQQFVLKFLWDQSAHTRTVGGVLFMLLGIAGIGLPLLLIRSQSRFRSLPPARQWLLAAGIPLAYVLLFALCMEASLRSTTLILPRPFTPIAVIRFQPGQSRLEFRGGWRPTLESGASNAHIADGVENFAASLHQGFLRHPRRKTITIVGRAERLPDGTVQIDLDVDAQEAVRFMVEGLDDVQITRDGQPLPERTSPSGTYQVTVTGRPRLETLPGTTAESDPR